MKKKVYSSYDEIDRDLEILNVERKLHYYKVKRSIDALKDNLTLPNLAMGLLDIPKDTTRPLVKTVFRTTLPFLVKKVFSLFVR
jgi:hypothetical protein